MASRHDGDGDALAGDVVHGEVAVEERGSGESVARAYTYDPRRYLFDVQVTGAVGALAAVAGAVMVATGFLAFFGAIALVLGLYTAFNTFIAKCYPRVASLDEEYLVLESFGRRDVYRIADIHRIQLRENGKSRSIYVRFNGGGVLRGRYFIGCGDMYDENGQRAQALYDALLDLQARLDPENIRVIARKQAMRAAARAEAEDAESRPVSRRHNRKKRRT